MKNKAYLLTAAILLTTGMAGYGQASGYLLNRYDLMPTDLFKLSETSNQFGTARSTAMGGAFTSLGADLSSMHINPAGLGMYQGSDISITPMVTFSKVTSKNTGHIQNGKNSKTRFAPANLGTAVNIYEGGGSLTSFTFGFAYNRLADFNFSNLMNIGYDNLSIADVWMYQLDGIPSSQLERHYNNFDMDKWGAMMAYRSGLLEETSTGIYDNTALHPDADVEHALSVKTTGSANEYNISGGFNFQNKLYFGFSIGIQEYSYRQKVYYDEFYTNNNVTDEPASLMQYDQQVKMSGNGVNFKAGFIYRPTDALRIGFAVHTPTYTTITHRYHGSLYMDYETLDNFHQTPYDDADFDLSTPARIMAGVSYTFGQVGVLSVDYERNWYNSMRYRTDDYARSWFNRQFKDSFTGSHILRVGAELRPTDLLSIRGGFNYATSALSYKYDVDRGGTVYDQPMPKGYYNISAGLGYRIGRNTTLDVVYVHNHTKYSNYFFYHYTFSDNLEFSTGNISQTTKRNTLLATLGFRF